jgi:threonine dehydrogenase-like Zn-dependent dehydrogenase
VAKNSLLSDIFPTGYHGTELAGVEPGRTVAIFGAGPVGLMAALSANIRGAAQTFVVDFQPDRLALAERLLLPFGRTTSTTQMDAVRVLGEIGMPQLPAHVVTRLRELATQDRRIVHSGHIQAFIHDDDQLRAAISDLIDDTGQLAAGRRW